MEISENKRIIEKSKNPSPKQTRTLQQNIYIQQQPISLQQNVYIQQPFQNQQQSLNQQAIQFQPIIYQQPYYQPGVVQTVPIQLNNIIVNQNEPKPTIFRKNPTTTICPFCNQKVDTKIEESFNVCTCLTIFFFIFFPFGFWNFNCTCRCAEDGCKECCICDDCCDFSCYDCTHKCSNCGKIVGEYDSCYKFRKNIRC